MSEKVESVNQNCVSRIHHHLAIIDYITTKMAQGLPYGNKTMLGYIADDLEKLIVDHVGFRDPNMETSLYQLKKTDQPLKFAEILEQQIKPLVLNDALLEFVDCQCK